MLQQLLTEGWPLRVPQSIGATTRCYGDPVRLNPHSDRPLYRQLADELRRQIAAGELSPGDRIPGEGELAQLHEVERGTVRRALEVLRKSGLITSARGRGTFVRERQPVRRISSDRYRVEVDQTRGQSEPATSFTADQGIEWSRYRLDRSYSNVPASADLAALLRVDEGTELLERQFTFWADDQPTQMSVSYYPLAMVAGTPVADPANEPWPGGNIAQLATLGITVTTVLESVSTRMPMPDEVEALRIPDGVPVFAITRRMLAGERVVEAAVDIIIPGDRAVLDYRIDVPQQ